MRPLPSAGVALYRREGWREGERKRAGDDGKVKEAKQRLPPFPSFYRPPRAFYFRLLTLLFGIPSRSLCGGESYASNGTRNSFRADPTK